VVLVVEDEALIRMGITEFLEDAGFVVRESDDGRAALASLGVHRDVDVVITDIDLPKMDGLKLVEEVRRRYPSVQVVLVSGKTYLRAHALPAGVPFFEKPVSESDLVKFLRALLASDDR
jgi:YesN/AraC family two-component response regulator